MIAGVGLGSRGLSNSRLSFMTAATSPMTAVMSPMTNVRRLNFFQIVVLFWGGCLSMVNIGKASAMASCVAPTAVSDARSAVILCDVDGSE